MTNDILEFFIPVLGFLNKYSQTDSEAALDHTDFYLFQLVFKSIDMGSICWFVKVSNGNWLKIYTHVQTIRIYWFLSDSSGLQNP